MKISKLLDYNPEGLVGTIIGLLIAMLIAWVIGSSNSEYRDCVDQYGRECSVEGYPELDDTIPWVADNQYSNFSLTSWKQKAQRCSLFTMCLRRAMDM